MKRIKINREQAGPNSTISRISSPAEPGLALYGRERAWLHDRSNVSCIPAGVYTLVPWTSPRFGDVWSFVGGSVTPFSEDSPTSAGRWGCLMHAANRWGDLNGCLAPGRIWGKDQNSPGDFWLPPPSKAALNEFTTIMGYEALVAYVQWNVSA